jgi:hypothetical protein
MVGPAIPPAPPMPFMQTPFTPQPPAPMFQSAWQQEEQQRQVRADQLYSYAMQVPSMAGQGATYGGAALMGARMGARMGPMGGLLGAAGGMAAAHFSGVAQGMGNLVATPFQPMREAHDMGAAIQRVSRSWVMGGQDVDPARAGLGREPSIQLASQIGQMAGDPGFKRETGGRFNQQDLMQIMSQAGRAGLMDQSQDVSAIRQNLRQTARTIKEFMDLTNDPDVSNVIKTMGQLRDVGMSQMQMRGAGANLRMYARSAGMSMADMTGAGFGGAQAFGGVGLAPNAGFQYGMQAAATARQGVAAGAFGPQQLAMMGGVQGLAGREMQAQAAFLGTPALAMAAGQFTPQQGWQLDPSALQDMLNAPGGVGAKELLRRARGSMRQGYQSGGSEALAGWPMQQRFVSAQMAEALTPQESMLMRFRTAQATGREMGLTGSSAFLVGAKNLYGEDVATQMAGQAASPGFWKMQRQGLQQRQQELGYEQYQQAQEERPGFFGRMGEELLGMVPESIRELPGRVSRQAGRITGAIGGFFSDVGNALEDQEFARQGVVTRRRKARDTMQTPEQRELRRTNIEQMMGVMERSANAVSKQDPAEVDLSNITAYQLMREGMSPEERMVEDVAGEGVELLPWLIPGVNVAALATTLFTDIDVGDVVRSGAEWLLGRAYEATMDSSEKITAVKSLDVGQRKLAGVYRARALDVTSQGKIAREMGLDQIEYKGVIANAAQNLKGKVAGKERLWGGIAAEKMTYTDFQTSFRDALKGQGKSDTEITNIISKLKKGGKLDQVYSSVRQTAGRTSKHVEGILSEAGRRTEESLSRTTTELQEITSEGTEKRIEVMGGQLWGGEYAGFEEDVTGLARTTSGIEFAAMASLAREESPEVLRDIYEARLKKKGVKDTDTAFLQFMEKVESKYANVSEAQKEGLKAARGDYSTLERFGVEVGQVQPFQAGIGGVFQQLAGIPGAGELALKPEALAGMILPEQRKEMVARGGKSKQLAMLTEELGALKEYTERKGLGKGVYEKTSAGILQDIAALGEEGEVTRTTAAAKGPEAERLQQAGEAMMKAQLEFTKSLEKFSGTKGVTFVTAVDKFNTAVEDAVGNQVISSKGKGGEDD